MFLQKSILNYPLLTLLSTGKKSFENMGRFIHRSGDTIARLLEPAVVSFFQLQIMSQSVFCASRKLFFTIDDTLIKKIHSRFMQGSGRFYDTKIGKRIIAYRLVLGMISDGKIAIPIDCAYLFSCELVEKMSEAPMTKDEVFQKFVQLVLKLFPKAKIIVLADGLYATVNILTWLIKNRIAAEMRMHSNRVVIFRGKKIALKDLLEVPGFRPKGRKMARTFTAEWHGLEVEITIVRRFDKYDKESIVFQVATYKASPSEHVANYDKRWVIEKIFRTTKQELGLEECFSTSLAIQHNHVAAVFVAYALAQLEMRKHKLKNPEEAIRLLKTKNIDTLRERFTAQHQNFQYVEA